MIINSRVTANTLLQTASALHQGPYKTNGSKISIPSTEISFALSTLNILGAVLTTTGIGLMGCSKKLQSTVGNSVILAGGMIITLLGMTSLCAGHQVAELNQRIKVNLNTIQEYEQCGDYANALKIARDSHKESLVLGLSEEIAIFSQAVERLEKSLLHLGYSKLLFDEGGQPRVKLLQLLQSVGMEKLKGSENAIVKINQWAQKNLLRQGERWQEQNSRFEELKPTIKPLLKDLGFVDAVPPHFSKYEGAIVHGALFPVIRLRLYYLVEQWKRGVRFNDLYFLSGERPLAVEYENRDVFIQDEGSLLKIRKGWQEPSEWPKTECEMIQLVWDQSEIPEDMRNQVKVYFINAPMKKDLKSEKLLRPNTEDTVEGWLKASPPRGRYLAVTNAPYINRQDLVVRTIASDEYGFETIGPGTNEQERMAIFLDELARFIFQTKQLAEKQENLIPLNSE